MQGQAFDSAQVTNGSAQVPNFGFPGRWPSMSRRSCKTPHFARHRAS
jgi:hypothetical protein